MLNHKIMETRIFFNYGIGYFIFTRTVHSELSNGTHSECVVLDIYSFIVGCKVSKTPDKCFLCPRLPALTLNLIYPEVWISASFTQHLYGKIIISLLNINANSWEFINRRKF